LKAHIPNKQSLNTAAVFSFAFWCVITTFRLQKWEYCTTQEKKERMNE
jgi:hypothetical protein